MTSPASSQSTDPRVAAYLTGLQDALRPLPEGLRSDVYDDIRQHIDDELAQRPGDATAVPEVLDRLGDPQDIAQAAAAEAGVAVGVQQPVSLARPSRKQEIAALILLEGGGFLGLFALVFHASLSDGETLGLGIAIAGFAWVVGVILLCTSRHFSVLDKIIGTLLIPGGFAGSLLVLAAAGGLSTSSGSCTGGVTEVGTRNGHIVHETQTLPTCTSSGPGVVHIVVTIVVLALIVLSPVYTTSRLGSRVSSI